MVPQQLIALQEARYSADYVGLVRVLFAGGLHRLTNLGGSPSDAIDTVFDALGLSSAVSVEKVAKSEAKTCLAFVWQCFDFPSAMSVESTIAYARRCSKKALLKEARRHTWTAPEVRRAWSAPSDWLEPNP